MSNDAVTILELPFLEKGRDLIDDVFPSELHDIYFGVVKVYNDFDRLKYFVHHSIIYHKYLR